MELIKLEDNLKNHLIYSSCRRRPATKALKMLDPSMRRDDDEVINQSFLKLNIPEIDFQ